MNDTSPVVFVVDDDAAVRKALARLIASAGYRVETYDSPRVFLDRVLSDAAPSCLVLDIQMPELTGLDLQRELNTADSSMQIVFLTGHGDIPMSVRAMKAGAADFFTKPVSDEELLGAIERALARAALDGAWRAERDGIRQRIASLTSRERQVMEQVVTGRLNKQIAAELGTVEKTIKVHRARVMEKMRAGSLANLVQIVAKAGVPPKQGE